MELESEWALLPSMLIHKKFLSEASSVKKEKQEATDNKR